VSNYNIEHEGVIIDINTDSVFVKILVHSACSACHAKGMCNLTDTAEKIIEVSKPLNRELKTGDKVNVALTRNMGFKAVVLSYLIPFLILFLTLIISLSIVEKEWLAGLISLAVLFPYYLILSLKKDKLKDTFDFKIV